MTEAEKRRMQRLEEAVRAAYCDVDDLLTHIVPKPGPNGRVQWARTKRVRDNLKRALDDVRPDPVGTQPLVLFTEYGPLR